MVHFTVAWFPTAFRGERARLDAHIHRWCRETGSSAAICLDCGSVLDHGKVQPAASVRASLASMEAACSCGAAPVSGAS